MLRMIQSGSAAHAKDYFAHALSRSDYYINDQELNGHIQGKLAERLGIEGPATREIFHALCDNIDPNTGETLTPRTREERTVGYDINFHCPKSVSILHGLANDDHLLQAFEESVRLTMRDIEADAKTRVRKEGQYDDRETGELVWADFIHQTARPVEGALPDPHLHAHCFVFNATWDGIENTIKAGQFRDIKRDMPYYQARFHKTLSDKMIELGYQVRRTEKSFEVVGVPQTVIDLFSKRSDEIGRVAKEKGITDAKELDALGARTRAGKQKNVSMTQLQADWRRQVKELATDEGEGEQIIRFAPAEPKELGRAKDCVDHAIEHGFERASVLRDRKILASAYRQGIGNKGVTLNEITDVFTHDPRIIQVKDAAQTLCTTKDVLKEEQRMVKLARSGQGKLHPLYTQAPALTLDGQQARAVEHILTTTNRVSIIRGAAGSGKTTLMKEAVAWMEKADKKVTVVAPTSQAARGVLKEEGFAGAETVARLLVDQQMQEKLENQILWVDEAGLLGTKDMTALLELATQKNARLILGGDTRQHSSVIRGDALRILNTVAGINTAEVNKIYRQRDLNYRQAVEDLARGDVMSAFGKLDGMGAIKEIDPLRPNEALVDDYVAALKKGKSALVIAPTHKQGEATTDSIRKTLRVNGKLGKKEIEAFRLVGTNLTEAEKADWRNIKEGQHIQFNQNSPGIKRGSRWIVARSSKEGVIIRNETDETTTLPLHKASLFEVYDPKTIALSKGDTVRITRNGFDQEKNRLNNGQTLQVKSVRKDGTIELVNTNSKARYRLEKEFGHIAHAHCITSHASQGKTVDEVFISQPAATFPATDAKQFYVSVSRGRHAAHIYTDDREQLLDYAARLGERQSALELVRKTKTRDEMIHHHIRREQQKLPIEKKAEPVKRPPLKDRTYEPGV